MQRISEPRPCPTSQRHRSVFFFRPCLPHVCLLPFIQTNTRSDAFFGLGDKMHSARTPYISSPLLSSPAGGDAIGAGPLIFCTLPLFSFLFSFGSQGLSSSVYSSRPHSHFGVGGPRIEMRLIYLAANDSTTLSHNKEPPGEGGESAKDARKCHKLASHINRARRKVTHTAFCSLPSKRMYLISLAVRGKLTLDGNLLRNGQRAFRCFLILSCSAPDSTSFFRGGLACISGPWEGRKNYRVNNSISTKRGGDRGRSSLPTTVDRGR